MRIYLDTNIFSSLKDGEFETLRSLVLNDQKNNIYLFSEAHLYDLARDTTDEKFADMDLIGRVCGRNCYYFDKQIYFNFFTPREYYERFDWAPTLQSDQLDLLETLALPMKLVSLRLSDHIKADQIPNDCPKDFIELLKRSTTLYDFFHAFLDFTDNLTNEQMRFREFLRYLHKNALTGNVYEYLGIKGFDGEKVTDQEAFQKTFIAYGNKTSALKDAYSVFTNMYNCLEILALVKGKPRKQKMTNLINDSRHAYFGSFCDIVVSRDEDFRKKCEFLYSTLGLSTFVCDPAKLESLLKDSSRFPSSYNDLIQAIKAFKDGEIQVGKASDDATEFYMQDLGQLYYGYFDTLTFTSDEKLNNFIFSKERVNSSLKAIQPELECLTNKLFEELGIDRNNKDRWDPTEVTESGWDGRLWLRDGLFIELIYKEKLFIRISALKGQDE